MTQWWRWPEDRRQGRVAWFVILRRLVVFPLVLCGIILLLLGVWLGYGYKEAMDQWRNL